MKTLILSLFTLSFFLPGNSPKVSFQEEITTTLSASLVFQKSSEYLASLPKVDKLLNNDVTGSVQDKYVESSRSFIAYKKNQFYKQPTAEVHYTVRIDFNEGIYSYQFYDFKVYVYKRNRYGVFNRSSSKAFGLEKLSATKQKELKPIIAMEINKYISGLKNALIL